MKVRAVFPLFVVVVVAFIFAAAADAAAAFVEDADGRLNVRFLPLRAAAVDVAPAVAAAAASIVGGGGIEEAA